MASRLASVRQLCNACIFTFFALASLIAAAENESQAFDGVFLARRDSQRFHRINREGEKAEHRFE
jgi:hypothetical protein